MPLDKVLLTLAIMVVASVGSPTVRLADAKDFDTTVPPKITSSEPGNIELAQMPECSGTTIERGGQQLLELADGSVATMAPMTVNVDGSGRAYHRDGYDGGAILHLCNAGQVHLPDGTRYHGSQSNRTCTGRFLEDVARIEAAGWVDPSVGAVRWYGILGIDDANVAGRTVKGVRPVYIGDTGFFVSPTALADPSYEIEEQDRYVDALSVPHAVVRSNSGIALGSLGVAWRINGCAAGRTCDPIPFIVGDIGPRIGEGSLWMTRAVNGLDTDVPITRENRYSGNISSSDVLWVFFGGTPIDAPYDAVHVKARAESAFTAWGGRERLEACQNSDVPRAND